MAVLGMLVLGVGYIAALAGGIWILVLAFQESVLWGICSLLIPFAALVFVIKYWEEAKKPFLIEVGGGVLIVLGGIIAGSGSAGG